ncbi:MAG: hypothetical protein JOZ75_09490 [Candidatus Dormibacteraeota bacterium]|nr:hypothetical protein [Candidatus Dormibacteraeota bacterium]
MTSQPPPGPPPGAPEPPPPPAAVQPPSPPTGPPPRAAESAAWWRRQEALLALLAAVAIGVSAFFIFQNSASAGHEVFLTPRTSVGQDPFTTSVANPPAPGTPAAAPSPAPPPSNAGIATYDGSTVGLYGGTLNVAVCDKRKMIDFLAANPVKQRAWAQAQGIATADVPYYISTLTPVLLRYDTRVTNHGFVNGNANPYEDVLQAGTAVLIDDFGVPRARCFCGNPLTPPISLQGTPTYTGPPWPGYQPTTVIIVQPAPQPQTTIIVVDTATNKQFPLPVGGGQTTAATASPSPSVGASPAATGSASATPSLSPQPASQPPPGDPYQITMDSTTAFGNYVTDAGAVAPVTLDMCKSVISATSQSGSTTTAVVNIVGSAITLYFTNTTLKGTYSPADGSFDATGGAPLPPGGAPSGVTVTGKYEAKGTISNTSLSPGTMSGAVRETIEVSSASLPGPVDGGCDYLFTGTKADVSSNK